MTDPAKNSLALFKAEDGQATSFNDPNSGFYSLSDLIWLAFSRYIIHTAPDFSCKIAVCPILIIDIRFDIDSDYPKLMS